MRHRRMDPGREARQAGIRCPATARYPPGS